MPPKSKSDQEIQIEKKKIIKAALKIISELGLNGLTMRKLAKALNMSATNIYHYFYNKDEIYLHILISGFDLLHNEFKEAISEDKTPLENVEVFLRTFIAFGKTQRSYYELMFSTTDPKSLDYTDTPIESLAKHEKENAMKPYHLFLSLLKKLEFTTDKDILWITTMRIIAEIHGAINLYHTNILFETYNEPDKIFENMLDHILLQFKS